MIGAGGGSSQEGSMLTRRAITTGLAAVPFAGTAAASPGQLSGTAPDPVFAAIESHQAAIELVEAFAANNDHDDIPDDMIHAEIDRLAELVAMTPTTPGGCVAMLRYVEAYASRDDDNTDSPLFVDFCDMVSEPAATLLGRIAAVIEQGRSSFP